MFTASAGELLFANEDSPAFIVGAFQTSMFAGRMAERLTQSFRTGEGIGWHEHHHELFHGIERFFRSGYLGNLVQTWIPALGGVEALAAKVDLADSGKRFRVFYPEQRRHQQFEQRVPPRIPVHCDLLTNAPRTAADGCVHNHA